MRRGLSSMSGLVVLALLGGATGLAEAQNGPYYAVPSWDQTLACATTTNCPRFIVVMGGVAVLDRETGLVWQQSLAGGVLNWQNAQFLCNTVILGNRNGWRLPTIQDLASLIDPSVPLSGPTLSAGNPFIGVQTSVYWSATTVAGSAGLAWIADFGTGSVTAYSKSDQYHIWCVRGGQGPDAQ